MSASESRGSTFAGMQDESGHGFAGLRSERQPDIGPVSAAAPALHLVASAVAPLASLHAPSLRKLRNLAVAFAGPIPSVKRAVARRLAEIDHR
jgi:hypothetical protein